ncbi:morn repeat-containing protein [Cystoisospora suis]|uniref:Morn repeat-containing protein n=1 Tax=Cystoisospora suis TaxID=483139 RepID=A0A2C6K9U0_9APIC|nr:morn repeat-containing protein [Cystoisospora suis]
MSLTQSIPDTPRPHNSNAHEFAPEPVVVPDALLEKFKATPLGVSPTEVLYILFHFLPEFQSQDETLLSLHESRQAQEKQSERDPTASNCLNSSGEQQQEGIPSALNAGKEKEADVSVHAGSAVAFAPSAETDSTSGEPPGTQSTTGNDVTSGSGQGPRLPRRKKERLIKDASGPGMKKERRNQARVSISVSRPTPAFVEEGGVPGDDAPSSSSAINALSALTGSDQYGSNSATTETRDGDSESLGWKEKEEGQSMPNWPRPFPDCYWEKDYAKLVRKILGKKASSWLQLAYREVTAIEMMMVLLKIVEYKTPPTLASQLELPVRLSLVVSSIADSLGATAASAAVSRPCWPVAKLPGEKNAAASSSSSLRVGATQDAPADVVPHSQVTEQPGSDRHRPSSGIGTQQQNDATTAHNIRNSFFWSGFDPVKPSCLREKNTTSAATDGPLVWNEEVDTDTETQWQELSQDASDKEDEAEEEADQMLNSVSPTT